jgi:hypothetical protein
MTASNDHRSLDVLARALAHAHPTMPARAQPIASNLIEQIGNLRTYVRPDWATDERQTLPWMIKQQMRMLERRLAR